MMHYLMLIFLLIASATDYINCQESAQYLQNVVGDLRKLNLRQTLRRSDTLVTATSAPQESDIIVSATIGDDLPELTERIGGKRKNVVPPLSLTKGELAAIYEAAVAKGETIKLDTGDNSYVHAAVHELDSAESQNAIHLDSAGSHSSSPSVDSNGYYYYYYPIKSFLDEMSSQPSYVNEHYPSSHHHSSSTHPEVVYKSTTRKPHYQYHSHHHQHNVNIAPMKHMMEEHKKPKALEPLFMAISGFIGMAVMFVLSAVVLPKFGIKKQIDKNDKFNDIAKMALRAIDGDCTERFACELGKTARSFHLQENRFVKLLRRMAPNSFGKQMDKVNRYSNKRIQCTAIPCKKKPANNANKKKAAPLKKP